MTWGAIDDLAIEDARALIGVPLRRERFRWVAAATRDALRHFAWGIGDDNPLWLDEEYALSTRWGGLVAPPCFLYAVDYTIVAPRLQGVQWIYAGTRWTWYDVIRLNDSFETSAHVTGLEEKSGRRFKRWVLQSGEVEYRNGTSALVARAGTACARTPRGEEPAQNGDGSRDSAPARYTEEELEAIEAAVLAERPRGCEARYWEDVSVGDEIPPRVKGPLSIVDIIAWYSATQGAEPYGGAHARAVRYRRRHADYHVNPATGAKDAAGRGHLEAETGKDVGMGGVYDIGPQRISWAGQMLTDWMGDDGFLHRLDVDLRRPNLVGDTTWWRGEVTGTSESGAAKLVDISVRAENQRRETTASGTATVALPSRSAGPVPLPLGDRA